MANNTKEDKRYIQNDNRKLNAKSVITIFKTALSAVKKPAVAVPSILYFSLEIIIMVFYLFSINKPFISLWAMLIKGIPPEALGHYPQHILLMQPILGRLNLFVDIFINVIFQGAIVLLVSSFLSGRALSLRNSFSLSIKRYIHLAAVSLTGSAAIFACINLSRTASESLELIPHILIIMTGIACGLIIQALILYAIPLILLKRVSAGIAMKKSISIAVRFAPLTLLIVILPFILTIPSILLDMKAELISLKLSPNFMIYHHIVKEILQTIASYLITAGSAVAFIRYISNRSGKSIQNQTEA